MQSTMTVTTETEGKNTLTIQRLMLHIEGLVVFAATIALYAELGGNGWLFVLLLLVPDFSALGFFISKETGTMAYNIVHTYSLPLALGVVALLAGAPGLVQIALIWGAHIGLDRAVGYGLKYASDFKHTHLGRV